VKYLLKIFSYVKQLWPYYVAIIVMGILISALNLAVPFIMKAVTDLVVGNLAKHSVDMAPVLWLAVGLFVVDVAATLIQNWTGYLGDVMSARLRQTLSNRYFDHLLSLPQGYYDNELTGTIINRLNRTITEVTQFINMFANNFFSMYLTLIVSIVILLGYSWELALMMTLLYPVFMWLTAKTSTKWQAWQKDKNLETDIASGRFAEVVAQIRVVKSFVKEQSEHRLFTRRNQQVVSLTRQQSAYWHKMDIVRRIVLNVIFFGAMAYVFYFTMKGRFSIGDMVLLTTLLNQMRFPVFNMSFIVDNLQKAIAGCRDYFEVMALLPAVADNVGAKDLIVQEGRIDYSGVNFGYADGKRVLHDISFTVKSGEKVALVGESGEGKTTLTSLLLRLYDIDSGAITIDGVSVNSVTQKSLRQNIGVVFQDAALFSGTIRENIAYGVPKATHEQIEKAAKAANAYDFIAKLEDGYDTEIGERGLKLSGGQKQRIAIARAILKDAPILILDEATSSLDSRAEKQVQEALDRLMQGRTTLIIAHRLSTIAHVDTIVTIKDGRVDEIGAPQALAKTNGIYSQLLELQMGTTEAAKKRLAKYEIAG
jgi:ATP-binding cassette subfamily B protein